MQVFDRWEEVERLFHAALELDPAYRTEFLSRTCTDPELLAEVNSLLEAHERGDSLLDRPPDKVAAEFLQELDARQDSLVGSLFDHYEVTGVLGEGGMGRVYLAQDSRLMRKVALKILPAPHVQSLERLRRFAQEARVASALNHPNIITVYDYGQALSSYYIATEYVEGRTLRSLIRDGIDFRKALEIGIQMASAFAAAHQAGIIHRDIKPENIMARADGLVKVLDFGLAKLSSQSESMTRPVDSPASVPGAVMGTFCYMSPEQARGRDLDARSDIFSYGIVMYEMLAGRRPFEGETLPDLLTSLVGSDPPPLSTYIPGAPLELEAILAGALARDRDQRYQSFEALLSDLTAVRRRLDAGESPKIPFHPSIGSLSNPMSDHEREATAQAETRESRGTIGESGSSDLEAKPAELGLYLAIGFVLVLAIAVAGYLGMKRPGADPNRDSKGDAFEVSQPHRITNDGRAALGLVCVSSDGKHFATIRRDGDRPTLVIREMTGSKENAFRLNQGEYRGVTFSPDGASVYYIADEPAIGPPRSYNLYRISTTGGPPRRIKENLDGTITFAPDGTQFAFVRNKERALMISSLDGSREHTVTSLDASDQFWLYPAWSPDGKRLACGVMSLNTRYQGIYAIKLDDGTRTKIESSINWVRIQNLAWGSDKVLVVNATDDESQAPGLWRVSYPDGKATKITNDLSGYYGASLTADSKILLSVRGGYNTNLYIGARGKDAGLANKINLGVLNNYGRAGLCWAPDGKVIYTAGPSEKLDLYVADPMRLAVGGPRALTANAGSNTSPSVTPDNRYVVFASDREERLSIWRMDRDGGHPKRLTPEGLRPTCLLDNKWIVYQVEKENHVVLWRVPIDGGSSEPLTTAGIDAENAAVSPDGTRVACVLRSNPTEPQIGIVESDGSVRPTALYSLPDTVRQPIIRWRDRQTLIYIDQRGLNAELWMQRLDRSQPRRIGGSTSNPKFSFVFDFDWAKSGRTVLSAGEGSGDVAQLMMK